MMELRHLDAKDSLRLKDRGIYEPWETGIVHRDLKPGDVFVDIGAHIGYYSVMASDIVGPSGRVFAFEPEPENFKTLSANIEGLSNITARRIALSSKRGTGTLHLSGSNSGDHSLNPSENRPGCATVSISTLDDELPAHTRVSFIKIDTQGHEPEVLAGMSWELAHSPGLRMLIEYTPHYLQATGHKPEDFLAFLRDSGFEIRTSATHDYRKCTVENGRHCNLYCVRDR